MSGRLEAVRYPDDRPRVIKPALVDKPLVLTWTRRHRTEVKFIEESRTFDRIVQQSNRAEHVLTPDIV